MPLERQRTIEAMLEKIFKGHDDEIFWRTQYDMDPEYRERANTLAAAMLQRLRVEDEMIKRLERALADDSD